MNEVTESVYLYVIFCLLDKHRPPSLQEIADACHLSKTAVVRHLDKLDGAGKVKLIPRQTRGIVIGEVKPTLNALHTARERFFDNDVKGGNA